MSYAERCVREHYAKDCEGAVEHNKNHEEEKRLRGLRDQLGIGAKKKLEITKQHLEVAQEVVKFPDSDESYPTRGLYTKAIWNISFKNNTGTPTDDGINYKIYDRHISIRTEIGLDRVDIRNSGNRN